jgi:hypothetical protein
LILLIIILGQAYCFWLEGRLMRYLSLYGLFVCGILVCLTIPGVNLRIHHYILALLLLPGTSLQTRLSLLYQGILLGLFVNGVARWDFDSILQTSDALRADARFDSVLPAIVTPTIAASAKGLVATFDWPFMLHGIDGFSVLINDVERHRGYYVDNDGNGSGREFNWTRHTDIHSNDYFRWAYLKDGRTLDYSAAGVWLSNGTWSLASPLSS